MYNKYKFLIAISWLVMPMGVYGVECPTDMSDNPVYSNTFIAVDNQMRCGPGYQLTELPESMVVYTSGLLLETSETLCGSNGYWFENECIPATQGTCDSGFNQLPGDITTLYKMDEYNRCSAGYEKEDIPTHIVYGVVNGMIIGSGETLCDDGYRLIGDTCVQYEAGDCPPDMFSYEPGVDTFVPITNGACATGYVVHDDNKSCGDSDSSDNFCAVLCDAGENWTYAGVCSARCTTDGIKRLHVGDLSFTTYTNKTTERALVFDNGSARCYGNMTLGRGTGTLNVNDENGLIWHLTE